MNPLRIIVFVFIDFILFLVAFFTGMYKSLFFESLSSSITQLPLHVHLRSLLLITVMSLPILLAMFLINQKFLHLFKKVVLYAHFALVVIIWVVLSVLIGSPNTF